MVFFVFQDAVAERRVGVCVAKVMSQASSDDPLCPHHPPVSALKEDAKNKSSKETGSTIIHQHHEDHEEGNCPLQEECPHQLPGGRRKLKNEDSSYDSDFDPCEPMSPRAEGDLPPNLSSGGAGVHEDIYRTVSDTLEAEYADYVTRTPTGGYSLPIGGSHYVQGPGTISTAGNTAGYFCCTSGTTIPFLQVSQATPPPIPPSSVSSYIIPSSVTSSSVSSCVTPSITSPSTVASSSQPCHQHSISTTTAASVSEPTSSIASTKGLSTTTCTVPSTSQTFASTSVAATTTTVSTKSDSNTISATPWVLGSPAYIQQVDFGVKLGYSENLVQLALSKLRGNPDKDELLAELIRLGKVPRPDSETDTTDVEGSASATSEAREEQQPEQPTLRPIIIDGSNVAMW